MNPIHSATFLTRSSRRCQGALIALTLSAIGLFFAGQATTLALPDNAMVVELANASGRLIDFAEIKHGNSQSQESIITLQIRPGETRRLVMNHKPGLGFNLIVLTGGERIEVCVGKTSQSRQLRQTFHDNGLIVESDMSRGGFVEHALRIF